MSILQLCTVRTNTMHAYCDIHENRWHVLALGKIKEKKSWRAVIFRGNWHTKYVRYTIKGSLERQLNRSTGNSGRWKVGWCFYMTATGIFLHIENEFPMYGTGYKHWRKSGFPGYKIQVFFKCTISWLLRTHIRTSRCTVCVGIENTTLRSGQRQTDRRDNDNYMEEIKNQNYFVQTFLLWVCGHNSNAIYKLFYVNY